MSSRRNPFALALKGPVVHVGAARHSCDRNSLPHSDLWPRFGLRNRGALGHFSALLSEASRHDWATHEPVNRRVSGTVAEHGVRGTKLPFRALSRRARPLHRASPQAALGGCSCPAHRRDRNAWGA